MHQPHRAILMGLLAALPACAIERFEAFLEEHGQTYVTTDVQDSDTSVADTTLDTTAASTSAGQDVQSMADAFLAKLNAAG